MRVAAFLLCALLAAPAGAQTRPDALTPDGGRYFGPLRNGKLHGQGRIEWGNGSVYEGGFVDGLMSGRGKVRWASGQAYEGEFRDGMLSGQGEITYPDGRKYRGEFALGTYHGRGRHETPDGQVHEGEFKRGEFTGTGSYTRSDGARYEGEFVNWQLRGRGRYTDPAGNVYVGEFKQWMFDGQGTLTYAKPQPDGTRQASGIWRFGVLEAQQREQRRRSSANAEIALYNQRALLTQAINALAPRDPDRINLFLLAVGGDGSQEVFRREVEFVRNQFAERFGTGKRSLALVNSRSSVQTLPMATVTSIREALAALAARMDRSQDILFVFLTSHGSREHELVLDQNGIDLPYLSAAELGRLLRESGIRWKVVVISACYAGGFLGPLKDDGTLVIAAARHDRQSFGCADENDFTYFGRAYFERALPQASSFQDAFRKAEALVHEMEVRDLKAPAATSAASASDERHSLPQMHSPGPIEQQLQRWWKQKR
ncbi:MAG TPA: C13 family peptidase [Burkholderiales bacterium]